MIVYKCLHGLAPQYLADDCVLAFSVAAQQTVTALEIGGQPEAGRLANTNCYWRQRFRGLLRCHPSLKLATYRSASLVTVCGDVCQTPESLLVSSPELVHPMTIYFALYKCTHYYYYYYSSP